MGHHARRTTAPNRPALKAAAKIRRLALRRAIGQRRAVSVRRNAILRKPRVPAEAEKAVGSDIHSNTTEELKTEPESLLDSVCLRPESCFNKPSEVPPSLATSQPMSSKQYEASNNLASELEIVDVIGPVSPNRKEASFDNVSELEIVEVTGPVLSNQSEPSNNVVSELVSVTSPVSSLRTMSFSLRYLYKNVLCNEDQCVRWLASQGLLRNEQYCSTCGVAAVLTRDRSHWRCRICKITMSLRHKSFFKEKRLPLTSVLELLYWWSLDTTESIIVREVGISRFVIGNWFYHLQRLCDQFFIDHPCLLGGPGKVVEVDACDFSSPDLDFSQRVLGMVERGSKSVFLTVLPNRHLRTAVRFVEKVVQPGSKVVSNVSSSYKALCSQSDLQFVAPGEADFNTAAVARLWRCVQDSLRRKSGRNQILLRYLKEIQFRLLMGDKVFGEILYWMDFYRW